MPRYTNDLNLPGPLFAAIVNDPYERGDSDISVTQLIDPPRKVALETQHSTELVEDVSDRVWSLMGQAIHTILERANVTGIAEERLYTEVEGWRVSGKYDHLDLTDGVLTDWKMASVWEWVYGIRPEREQQLNLLAHIAQLSKGYRINKLRAAFIFRDWQKSKARLGDGDYPPKQVMVVDIPMWPAEIPGEFLRDRVRAHQRAQQELLPLCTDDERWAKPTTYALKKEGRKSAIRVLESPEAIEDWALGAGFARRNYDRDAHGRDVMPYEVLLERGYSIEERPGENTRCAAYCPALAVCSQGQALVGREGDWIAAEEPETAEVA